MRRCITEPSVRQHFMLSKNSTAIFLLVKAMTFIVLVSANVCAQEVVTERVEKKPTRIAVPKQRASAWVRSTVRTNHHFRTHTHLGILEKLRQHHQEAVPNLVRPVSHFEKDSAPASPTLDAPVRNAPSSPSNQNVGQIPSSLEMDQSRDDANSVTSQLTALKSDTEPDPSIWWNELASDSILNRPEWVKFDMETVLLDTLDHSPRIRSLTHGASMALERIVQQDASFDPTMMLGSMMGKTNDPVGNTLTTGGAPRLIEDSMNIRGGLRMNSRRGTEVGLNQELGLLNSNSTFFSPNDQGNARLGLSLTQPLLSRGGQVYNERLLTQARIDSKVTWQEMRGDVEQRIAEVMSAYWRLYEARCQLLQQQQLLERAEHIERMISERRRFDSSLLEISKARGRVAARRDQLVVFQAEVKKRQTRLATLIGSDALCGAESQLELIPEQSPIFPFQEWDLRDVTVQALENRPDVKAAGSQLEAAALALRVTRTELVPQLNAVVNASLSALNGNNDISSSFLDQFSGIAPGFSAGLQYEMPYRKRAAQSRHREAFHQYRKRSEELREVMQQTQYDVRIALENVRLASEQRTTKLNRLQTALKEETIETRRWELIGAEGSRSGVVLENLLDAQQRRTDAERDYVTMQSDYMLSLVELQRAMGTLLQYEGIDAVRSRGQSTVDFVLTSPSMNKDQPVAGNARPEQPLLDAPLLKARASERSSMVENQPLTDKLAPTVKR